VRVESSLCVVLLSLPTTSGVRTANAVSRAARLLGHNNATIVNLIDRSAIDVPDLARFGPEDPAWQEARSAISRGLHSASDVLFGWGVVSRMGSARLAVQSQVTWTLKAAAASGHLRAWAVGEGRHPSRWHQYVADRHARTLGGTADARLRQVLRQHPLAYFAQSPSSRLRP